MAQAKRSAKQIAATKKMLAANRAARTAKKTGHSHAKRSGSRPAAAKTQVVVVRQSAPAAAAAKPKPKSRAQAAASKARAATGKAMTIGKTLLDDVGIPIVVGAGAASAVDVVYGAVRRFIPAEYVDSPAKPVIKTVLGVAGAMVAQHFGVKPKYAKQAAVGVGTVQLHGLINSQIEQHATVNLNGLGMTVGDLAAVLPGDDMNGLEALGALATGDASLGAVLPYYAQQEAA